ncbi:glycosyltransferase family 4 protein [Candidatus Woesearchaeota archaeon]|nr:glycosyltransferase family 4 protein [Candidatus Woesearchaeota archaeon]
MNSRLYLICRHFTPNSGSYAGMFEQLSRYANSQGYKVVILCGQIDKKLPLRQKFPYASLKRFPIPLFKLPIMNMNKEYIFLSRKIRKYFRENPPGERDLIIVNSRAAFFLKGYKYVLRIGQPALVFLKNMEIAKHHVSMLTRLARFIHFYLQHLMELRCAKNAIGYISSSLESRNHVVRSYGGKNKPYFIPHSGLRYREFSAGKKIDVPGIKLLFVSAGTEKIRKGIIHLEKALPEIMKRNPNVRLLHVGDRFKWDVPGWCSKRITSVGRIPWDKMADYYASSDVLVVCSLNEMIPNIIFEAMAAGTPVVTSDMDGMREVITHLKEGYIYRRGDVKGLITGIQYLLDNPQARKNIAETARKKVKPLDYSNFAKKLLRFSEEIKMKSYTESINLLK